MRKPTILTTILAAALIAGPGAATAQDFEDDFEEDFDDGGDTEDDGGDMGDDGGDFGGDFDEPADDGGDAAAASGGGEARGLGVGAIAPLAGFGEGEFFGVDGVFGGAGPAVSYDAGGWHIDGVLRFATNGETSVGVAARGWYHLFQADDSDFSVGGGLSFANVDNDAVDESANLVNVEAGAKIRMFLVPQVALSQTTGVVIGLADADGVALGGQVLGGVTYFFD